MSEPIVYREQAKRLIGYTEQAIRSGGDHIDKFQAGVLNGLAAIAWALLDVADSVDQKSTGGI